MLLGRTVEAVVDAPPAVFVDPLAPVSIGVGGEAPLVLDLLRLGEVVVHRHAAPATARSCAAFRLVGEVLNERLLQRGRRVPRLRRALQARAAARPVLAAHGWTRPSAMAAASIRCAANERASSADSRHSA